MSNAFAFAAGLPEMEGPGWTSDDFVRDFDVDYTLVMENLMDPDHGLFAHQVWLCCLAMCRQLQPPMLEALHHRTICRQRQLVATVNCDDIHKSHMRCGG